MLLMNGQFNKQDADAFNKRIIKKRTGPRHRGADKNLKLEDWENYGGRFFLISRYLIQGKVLFRTALLGGAVKILFPGV